MHCVRGCQAAETSLNGGDTPEAPVLTCGNLCKSIIPRTNRGNRKGVAMVDVFTRYVRPVFAPDEKAETIAKVVIDEWISLFGPIGMFLSDRGPNMMGEVLANLTQMLGIKKLTFYPLNTHANGALER